MLNLLGFSLTGTKAPLRRVFLQEIVPTQQEQVFRVRSGKERDTIFPLFSDGIKDKQLKISFYYSNLSIKETELVTLHLK